MSIKPKIQDAFRAAYDSTLQNYTHFSEPIDSSKQTIDAWNFIGMGWWNGEANLSVTARNHGKIYDINFGAFDLPIVTQKVVKLLEDDGLVGRSVQLVPVQYRADEVYILNVIPVVAALDEARSEFIKWKEVDERPDRLGAYREVTDLKVFPEAAESNRIFRVKGWEVALIVCNDLKRRLEKAGVQGAQYINVSQ